MKSLIIGLFLTLGAGFAMGQSNSKGPLPDPIQVVEAQLAAFQDGEWELAYGYATADIKAMFPSPKVFQRMVEGGYGYMTQAQDVQLTLLNQSEENAAVQAIFLSGQVQIDQVAYTLAIENGQWRIAGVFQMQASQGAT